MGKEAMGGHITDPPFLWDLVVGKIDHHLPPHRVTVLPYSLVRGIMRGKYLQPEFLPQGNSFPDLILYCNIRILDDILR